MVESEILYNNDIRTCRPLISVCMPVYNRREYISECIKSVLNQTFSNFEFIIVDDGSTDGTTDLIQEFKDERIRLIKSKHDYIASCNKMLDEARGKYVARMDSDDIMMPDRLEFQYNYMESHPEVDILGGSIERFGDYEDPYIPPIGDVSIQDLLSGGCIVNPTNFMRLDKINATGIRYDKDFNYAEDYHFFACAIMSGLRLRNVDKVFLKYRICSSQVSEIHMIEQYNVARRIKSLVSQWIARDEIKQATSNIVEVPLTGNRLSVIIPFLNEGEEVVTTVRSIREHAGENVDIIVINDQSNDCYPYREQLMPFNVFYFYNTVRKGVAASRDFGISKCRTPYFLLLDAHMRFYNKGWHDIICNILDSDDRVLLCCQTRFLKKTDDGTVYEEKSCLRTFGAYIPFIKGNIFPDISWNYHENSPNDDIEDIPAVLGAGYATSVRYWTYLHGLQGLKSYGSDEAYISLKVWLEGGRCRLLKNVIIGHIYRTSSPFVHESVDEIYNNLFIAYLLLPRSLRCMSFATALKKDRDKYKIAHSFIDNEQKNINNLKKYYLGIFTRDFAFVLDIQRKGQRLDTCEMCNFLSRLPDVASFLSKNVPESDGLYEGKVGLMIWLLYYGAYSDDESYNELVSGLWDDIVSSVESGKLAWNFRYGLCGIGWGIIHLFLNGILDEIPDEVIARIDSSIKCIDAFQLDDYGVETGAGGLFAYLSIRHRLRSSLPWSNDVSARFKKAAIHLLNTNTDLLSYYYAMSYLSVTSNNEEEKEYDLPPALSEWLNVSPFLPADERFWTPSLAFGCAGATILPMIAEMKCKNFK